VTYLLSDEGRCALRSLATQSILYAFDFDGTLAPISSDRHAVKMSPLCREWLHKLSKLAACAVVSGRALSDVTPRVNGTVPHVIGNHGIESPLVAATALNRAEAICAHWSRDMTTGMAQSLTALGVEVEDKRYSLTVHFRRAPDPVESSAKALMLLSRLTPMPHLIPGKYSINVLPSGQGGKGPAALALMEHLRLTGLFYIGDEDTDETVFALTRGLTMGVRVGQHAGSHARFYLHHQGEVEEVLRFLVHQMDRPAESPYSDSSNSEEKRKSYRKC